MFSEHFKLFMYVNLFPQYLKQSKITSSAPYIRVSGPLEHFHQHAS